MARSIDRPLALWFPDWPVTAWALATGATAGHPIAVVAANRVVACSPAAAAEGVLVGQRRREAQSRCPELQMLADDLARDAREFEPVVACVEELAPGVQVIRPGLCALRARGLATYVGGEAEAAEVLLEAVVVNLGIESGRVGIADGLFAAVQAARGADPVRVVPAGESAAFLAPLPVSRLGDADLAGLLPRLGVRTLGEFASLDAASVRERFGQLGQRLHLVAAGLDPSTVQGRVPPPELVRSVSFEPPLSRIDQVAFTAKATATDFISALAAAGLACTELRVELTDDRDNLVARTWLTPGVFDAAAVIDRVRWQLQAAVGNGLRGPVVALRLEPVAVDDLANHAPGLFGSVGDERVHHVLSRVQAMLGHTGVVTSRVGGGRWLAERQVLVPWGDRPVRVLPRALPWPGQAPDPLPAAVFADPLPVRVLAGDGSPAALDERGQLSQAPAVLQSDRETRPVLSWAGPWLVAERAWDAQRRRTAGRFQVVDATGTAWLLFTADGSWWVEARYD